MFLPTTVTINDVLHAWLGSGNVGIVVVRDVGVSKLVTELSSVSVELVAPRPTYTARLTCSANFGHAASNASLSVNVSASELLSRLAIGYDPNGPHGVLVVAVAGESAGGAPTFGGGTVVPALEPPLGIGVGEDVGPLDADGCRAGDVPPPVWKGTIAIATAAAAAIASAVARLAWRRAIVRRIAATPGGRVCSVDVARNASNVSRI